MIGGLVPFAFVKCQAVAHLLQHRPQFDEAVGNILAETEHETEAEEVRRDVPGCGAHIPRLNAVSGNKTFCADGIERFKHVLLPPVKWQCRYDQAGT